MHYITRNEAIPAVAPFTGAWIEIIIDGINSINIDVVAPFTGAWIEIERRGRKDT